MENEQQKNLDFTHFTFRFWVCECTCVGVGTDACVKEKGTRQLVEVRESSLQI